MRLVVICSRSVEVEFILMGRRKSGAQKRKNSSEGTNCQSKSARNGGSSENSAKSVSGSIHMANSVLYGDNMELNNSVFESTKDISVSGSSESTVKSASVSSVEGDAAGSPSNMDILKYLKRMDLKMTQMDCKLNKLDSLEQKVSSFDSELKKLWSFVHEQLKSNKDDVSKVSERIDTLEFSLGMAQDQITHLTTEKAKMQDSVLYMQSQSMRNNLIFVGITEDVHEKPEATEQKLRQFMVEKLNLAQDCVDGIRLERVHRIGDNSSRSGASTRPRSIVAKFLHFQDRELVRRSRSHLKRTAYYVNEQFPKENADRRRLLFPKMRQAIREGKTSWISYNTLYINGRPVRNETH